MDQDKYIALVYKKLQGKLNAIEKVLLDNWLSEADINRTLAKKIEEDWQLTESYQPNLDVDLGQEFSALQQRIKAEDQPIQKATPVVPMKKRVNWMPWAAAAMLVFAVGTWFLTQGVDTNPQLAALNTTQEQQQITLEDGTKVWVNEQSQLRYPTTFDGTTRTVHLKGEAFFDVHRDAEKPFIIETEASTITVLGTSFNVRALDNSQETEVVVKTGKVRLASADNTKAIELVANEKGIHQHPSNQVKKMQEEDMNELSWQTKVLFFKGTPVPEVVTTLERLFKVQINIQPATLQACTFTARIPQPNLEGVLKAVCQEFDIQLSSTSEGQYQLRGGVCN